MMIGALVLAANGDTVFSGDNNAESFGHNMELKCMTAEQNEPDTNEAFPQMKFYGEDEYSGNDVFKSGAVDGDNYYEVKCAKGWTMTGCTQEGQGHIDMDLKMDSNSCHGDNDNNEGGKWTKLFIRCCKIEKS